MLETESMMDLCALMVSADKKTTVASIVLVGDDTLRHRFQLAANAQTMLPDATIYGSYPLPKGLAYRRAFLVVLFEILLVI